MTDVTSLQTRLMEASITIHSLLNKIEEIEKDQITSVADKRVKIKKIKEEITKVGMEIDNIKREYRLLNAYRVN